jgi:hypothetical protein
MDTRSKMAPNIPPTVAAQRKASPVISSAPTSIPAISPVVLMRMQRNFLITQVEWMRTRHLDQVASSQPTTLTSDQYNQLLAYIQALRNVPQNSPNPPTTPISWPTPPSFIPTSMTTLGS